MGQQPDLWPLLLSQEDLATTGLPCQYCQDVCNYPEFYLADPRDGRIVPEDSFLHLLHEGNDEQDGGVCRWDGEGQGGASRDSILDD